MKSKYLILQIDIGSGTQWGKSQTINPIRKVFIPSVKKYCQKFNYDYSLIKESTYKKDFGRFDFLETKNILSLLIKTFLGAVQQKKLIKNIEETQQTIMMKMYYST